jgi:hypothetical protein
VCGGRAGLPDRDPKVNLMQIALIVIALVVVFEYAALRWGFDSRELLRAPRS